MVRVARGIVTAMGAAAMVGQSTIAGWVSVIRPGDDITPPSIGPLYLYRPIDPEQIGQLRGLPRYSTAVAIAGSTSVVVRPDPVQIMMRIPTPTVLVGPPPAPPKP